MTLDCAVLRIQTVTVFICSGKKRGHLNSRRHLPLKFFTFFLSDDSARNRDRSRLGEGLEGRRNATSDERFRSLNRALTVFLSYKGNCKGNRRVK